MTKSLNNGHRAVKHYLQHYNTTHMNDKETSDRYSSEKAVCSLRFRKELDVNDNRINFCFI